MNDLHTHVLHGNINEQFDLNESLRILKELEKSGIKNLVLTPHYIIGTNYMIDNKTKLQRLKEIQKKTKSKLYLGNEVFIDNDILRYINEDKISTINGSRYLLIEFPIRSVINNASIILKELIDNDIIPVIAHPERYRMLSISKLKEYKKIGCLFQGNITSLNNKYGLYPKIKLMRMLLLKMIDVMGSDTHINGKLNLNKSYKLLRIITSKKYYKDITINNFNKIVQDKKI